ncbi:MAG: hypothetical protein EBS05_09605, partial [Proteobacteria bacterium]|nr:hypothetical protein [Pseudomonadota bacterium]
PDWKLVLATERLPARVVAEVFNLVTVGDGIVGGSATIRFGILNQGIQEFKVRLPGHWKNVEFTGPNIRRKESSRGPATPAAAAPALDPRLSTLDTNTALWTISLQDKAWGGYTLVVTYDYQFDPKKAALDLAGAHCEGVERETGSLAVTAAANLKLQPKPAAEPLRAIDPSELAETDRALITRPVLLAYRYTGGAYALAADAARFDEERVLDAVADRTQITSVVTEAGEMLSQASFMVKNNEKQFQRFKLPPGANFWGCYVNNQPSKADRDGESLIVPLPRGENRDEAFAVDIVYAQKLAALDQWLPQHVALIAPATDVPNTYAEWQLFVPSTKRVSRFGGTMTVARGTTYEVSDAWYTFAAYYRAFLRNDGMSLLFLFSVMALVYGAVVTGMRRGMKGLLRFGGIAAAVAMIGGFMYSSLAPRFSEVTFGGGQAYEKGGGRGAPTGPSAGEAAEQALSERLQSRATPNALLADVDADGPVDLPLKPQSEMAKVRAKLQREAGEIPASELNQAAKGEDASRKKSEDRAFAVVRKSAPDAKSDGLKDRFYRVEPEGMALSERATTAPATPPPDASPKPVEMYAWGQGLKGKAANQSVVIVNDSVTAVPESDGQRRAGLARGTDQSGVFQLGTIAAGGMGGGGYTVAGVAVPNSAGEAAQTAVGMRSIRIDIPRSGQAFTFTKVLNLKSEPLGIELALMPLGKFRAAQSAGQLALFLGGLLLALIHWRRADRNSFGIALGVALALAGVIWLGLSARMLHWVMIGAVPVVGGPLLCWLAWRMWPRGVRKEGLTSSAQGADAAATPAEPNAGSGPGDSGSVPPAAAAILVLLLASQAAFAQDSIPHSAFRTPHSVTLQSASYTGTIREKSAEFTATLALSSTGTNQTFTLFGGDVAIQSFTAKTGEARLVREGGTARVWLPKAGAVTLELKLLARLEGDVTKRRLAFGLPPALASQFTAVIEEPDADVEFPTAVSFKRTSAGKQTRVDAIIGSTDRVDLAWTPRLKRIAEMDATVFAQTATLVTIGGGVVNSRAVVNYQIAQGELRQAKVRLPAGQRLLRVEGEGIRTWELLKEGNTEVLAVDLLKGVSANWQLVIETENSLGALPATVKLEVPVVQDVRRESGLVAVRGAEETSLAVETAGDLQRVDLAAFNDAYNIYVESALQRLPNNRGNGGVPTAILSAFRYLRSTFDLTVKADTVKPVVEVLLRNHYRVGTDEHKLSVALEYTIKHAGIFNLRLALPSGWTVDSVVYPELHQEVQRSEHSNAGERVMVITLPQRTIGRQTLVVNLSQLVKSQPGLIDIATVRPIGVQKLEGYVTAFAEPGILLKTRSLEGMTEIPAGAMSQFVREWSGQNAPPKYQLFTPPGTSATLAFKLIPSTSEDTTAWKLDVATEQLESWVRAEVVNLISVSETLVSGRALVRLDIANAPVKEFRLKIPLSVTNVDITGPNIRRRDQTGDVWRVELQNKLRGQHTFMVTWEQARVAKSAAPVDVPAVEVVGVERETGAVAILAKPPLQVSEKSASAELMHIDTRELPDWATGYASGTKGEQLVLMWRYLRPGWKLAVLPQRFAEAAVLQALVDSARLTTVVADDGQMMTEVSLSMRNNGRQFLEVELPAGAMVWSAFVNGQPVRPTKQAGKLLLPLEQSGGDAALPVEFTYVAADQFPKRQGGVALASPKFDVPLKNARWELLLPPDYEYTDFGGTMGRDLSGAPVVTVNYSATDYSRQEAKNREVRDSESKSSLGRLSSLLSSGKLSEANGELFNYKRSANPQGGNGWNGNLGIANSDADGEEIRQLKAVEKQLRQSQASNLVQAQQAYTLDNATKLGVQTDGYFEGGKGANALYYDTAAAEQQLDKLQKAQEVTVATVQPLRVNLPLRGQRHAFTQVLQTEVNKPMTVAFAARNLKAGGWLKPVAYTLCAFLALWIAVAILTERRQV